MAPRGGIVLTGDLRLVCLGLYVQQLPSLLDAPVFGAENLPW